MESYILGKSKYERAFTMEVQKKDNPEITLLHATERVGEAIMIGTVEYIRKWCTALIQKVPGRDIKKAKLGLSERKLFLLHLLFSLEYSIVLQKRPNTPKITSTL